MNNANLSPPRSFLILLLVFIATEHPVRCDEIVCSDAVLGRVIQHLLSTPIRDGPHADRVAELERLSRGWSINADVTEISVYHSSSDEQVVSFANVRWWREDEGTSEGKDMPILRAEGEMFSGETAVSSRSFESIPGVVQLKRVLKGRVISSRLDIGELSAITRAIKKVDIPSSLPIIATPNDFQSMQKLLTRNSCVIFSFRSMERKYVLVSDLHDEGPGGLPKRTNLRHMLLMIEKLINGVEYAE